MKTLKEVLPRAAIIFVIFAILTGLVYTGVVTGIAQLFFPNQAGGSIIEIDGKKYGSALLGQQYTDDAHMWGRIMNIDVGTYTDEDGKGSAVRRAFQQDPGRRGAGSPGGRTCGKSSARPIRIWRRQPFRWIWSPVPAADLTRTFPRRR